MGMGYCGNFAVVISSESVASVVGEELYKPFLEVLKKISDEYKISEGDLVYNLEQGEDCADGNREISDKWNSILCEIEDKFLNKQECLCLVVITIQMRMVLGMMMWMVRTGRFLLKMHMSQVRVCSS